MLKLLKDLFAVTDRTIKCISHNVSLWCKYLGIASFTDISHLQIVPHLEVVLASWAELYYFLES